MSAAAAPASTLSPLGRLPRDYRQRVIAAIAGMLPPVDAAVVLAALAGTPDEVNAIPEEFQDAAQIAVLAAFPPGHGAIVVSQLGLARVATESWLPALRERFSGMGVAGVADALREVLRRHRVDPAAPADGDIVHR